MDKHGRADQPGFSLASPWYRGFSILAVCLTFQALTLGVTLSSFAFFAEQWSADFGVERSKVVLAISLCVLGSSAISPFAGRFFDKAEIRFLIAGGLAIHAVGLGLLSFVDKTWQILLIYSVLMPISVTVAGLMPGQVLAVRWFPKRRGLALGIVGSGLGAVLTPPLVNALIEAMGWRDTLQTLAWVTAGLMIPLVLVVVRNEPEGAVTAQPGAAAVGPGAGQITVPAIIKARNFWILAAFVLFPIGTMTGLQVMIVAYAGERGVSSMEAAGILSTVSIASISATFFWGYLSDRLEHRFLLSGLSFLAAAACVGLAFTHGVVGVTSCILLMAFAIGGVLPLMSASLTRQFGPAALGRATGIMAAVLVVRALFPPAVAKGYELAEAFAPVLIVCALLMAGSGLIVLTMKNKESVGHPAAA